MMEENKQVLSKKTNEVSQSSPLLTTGKKEKDPKKVEAGKRLAQISREAKERKKKKILEASKENNQETSILNIPTLIFFSILSLGVISYFTYFKKQKESATLAQSALEEKQEKEKVKIEKKLLDKREAGATLLNFDFKKNL